MEHSIETTVDGTMTASAVGSGGVEVLATPWMILLFEQAARDAVQEYLPEGQTTVGTRVDIRHVSATPVGERVTAEAVVKEIDGRRIVFHVSARDEHCRIGFGTHERYIVELDEFMRKLSGRSGT